MPTRRRWGPVANVALSYALAVALIGTLLRAAGLWDVLANSRFLDLLIRGGVVQLTDMDAGYVPGVPDLDLYVRSQDPIDGGLLAIVALVFLLVLVLRALQFHDLARASGIEGSRRRHMEISLHGAGVGRWLPFGLGGARVARDLRATGAPADRAAFAVYLGRLSRVGEILVFGVIGLMLVGWSTALSMLVWPAIVAVAGWLLVRPRVRRRRVRTAAGTAAASVRILARRPDRLARVGVLSAVAFLLEDVAAYLIVQAFSSPNVVLGGITPSLLVMALVGANIARLFPVTPGGIGQWEVGFTAVLVAGGVGLPEALTIALIDNVFRTVVCTGVLGVTALGRRSSASRDGHHVPAGNGAVPVGVAG
jgi:uncharacterized membrane protein YbhN (UPF0104 family)